MAWVIEDQRNWKRQYIRKNKSLTFDIVQKQYETEFFGPFFSANFS